MMKHYQWGGLNCLVLEPRDTPAACVVLCHGYGATGDDLAGLADMLIGRLPPAVAARIGWVFPEAPCDLAAEGYPEGRAWWPLNLARLQQLVMSGQFGDIRRDTPPGMEAARAALGSCLKQVLSHWQLTPSQLVLGGFSQGAMLATDTALHCEELGLSAGPGGLVLWSGTLVNETQWLPRASRLAGTPVVQSHGRYDVVLPMTGGEWLRELLETGGAKVEFVSFSSGHTIPETVLTPVAKLIEQVAACEI